MTNLKINLTSEEFIQGCNVETADGKVFEVGELFSTQPRLSLEGVKVGSILKMRNGGTYRVVIVDANSETLYPVGAVKENEKDMGLEHWFGLDGRSCLSKYKKEIIEITPPSILDQIKEQLNKLNSRDINEVVVPSHLSPQVTDECRRANCEVDGKCFVNGVRIYRDPFDNGEGFCIRFKLT
jgi:hypothetical protein